MNFMSNFLNRKKVDFVFVDWFGVLSINYYWCIQSQKKRLLREWCDCVFNDEEVLNQWMRGTYTLKFLTEFRVKVDEEYIIETFLKDIEYYKPDSDLLESLETLFPKAKKILVSDNMTLFNHILNRYPILNNYFYKFYLSYEFGLLKSDKPFSLFDYIQSDLKLSNFESCLLIDDHYDNCNIFKAKGGRTILIS